MLDKVFTIFFSSSNPELQDKDTGKALIACSLLCSDHLQLETIVLETVQISSINITDPFGLEDKCSL